MTRTTELRRNARADILLEAERIFGEPKFWTPQFSAVVEIVLKVSDVGALRAIATLLANTERRLA